MAHISDLRAGIFTYLDMYTAASGLATADTDAEMKALFVGSGSPVVAITADGQVTGVDTHLTFPSVREFPSIGTPANIVNVPVYGQKTTSQVQGQSDAPSLEVTVNYNANDMADLHALVGTQIAFRFMMAAAACTLDERSQSAFTTANTSFFFKGKIEAILVNSSLTDATTATITLSAQTDFIGPSTK